LLEVRAMNRTMLIFLVHDLVYYEISAPYTVRSRKNCRPSPVTGRIRLLFHKFARDGYGPMDRTESVSMMPERRTCLQDYSLICDAVYFGR
jgi:hypothetical protein